jgi:hypothetical protein
MTLQVKAQAPVESVVDLSVLCMFEHEMSGFPMGGGLLSFDQAIGGALKRLRDVGAFRGQQMETLFLPNLPRGVLPRSAMVIGLGDPDSVSVLRLEQAARVALREAVRLGARSVAFAPDLLDSGVVGLEGVAKALLTGVVDAYLSEEKVESMGLGPSPSVETWTFNVGLEHLDPAELEYTATFRSLQARAKLGGGTHEFTSKSL